MLVSEAMALVTVDAGPRAIPDAVGALTAAFRSARLPIVHVVETALAAGAAPALALDVELLEEGGVQTLAPAEMAIALTGRGAFDATPLDALLRGLGVDTVVVAGPVPSLRVSSSVMAAELRGYRVLLATDELAITLGAFIRAA
jgi:nicotinamidase-related amidase